jgi:hypothetical protein
MNLSLDVFCPLSFTNSGKFEPMPFPEWSDILHMVIEYEYLWILTYEYFTWLRYLVCSILSACGIVGREIESRQKIKLLPNTSVKQIDLYLKVISILSLTKICCCT